MRGHEYFVCAEKHGLLCVPDKVSREPDEERDNYNNYNSPATNAEEQESDEDGSSDSWGSDSSDGSEVESESESDYVGDCGQEAVLPTSTSTSLDSVTARPLQTFRFPGPPSAGQCSTTAPSMLMGLSPHCSSFSLDRLHGRLAKKGWLTKLVRSCFRTTTRNAGLLNPNPASLVPFSPFFTLAVYCCANWWTLPRLTRVEGRAGCSADRTGSGVGLCCRTPW